jgi:hypothetical protein
MRRTKHHLAERPLLGAKRTCRGRRRRINPTRVTRLGHRRLIYAVMHKRSAAPIQQCGRV